MILKGLRVVEGSAFVAAPLGAMTLGQLGAEIIRFDQIGGGPDYHRWPIAPSGVSLYWAGLNKGKKSIALDLRRPEGRELAVRLITAPGPDAGIFLTNFPDDGWLNHAHLSALRPDLIQIVIEGNFDGSSAVDYTVNCAVGYPSATGPVGTQPVNHVLPAWDAITGATASAALLAAERHRARTGAGSVARIALSDIAISMAGALGHIAEAQILGRTRPPYGNDLYGAFGRDFATADDRRVMIVAITGRQWQAIVRTFDLGEPLAALEKRVTADFTDEGDRWRFRNEIAELIAPWVASRPYGAVTAALEQGAILWGPYQDFLQLVREDKRCSTDNPIISTVEQPGIGSYNACASPIRFGNGFDMAARPAPVLGQHTEEILAEILGMSSGEIGTLHDLGHVASASAI